MKLPTYPHVLFGRSPLVLVVGQVRFSALPGFADGSNVAAFDKRIREMYPKRDRIEQISFSLSPAHGVEHQSGPMLWKFSTVDNAWSVVLAESALTLEVRGYTSVTEFLDRFATVLDCLIEELDPGLQTRVGLRYIDEFRYRSASTVEEWAVLICPEILGFATAADDLFGSSTVQHTRQQLEVNMPNGTLMIRHGLLSGTSVEPIAEEAQSQGAFYLLDMDYYDGRTQPLDREVVIATLRSYNDTMYRFFRWVMREPLYRSLEPQDEA
jgi:uncharacterized protein (TIGR04255 family)